jgi:Zinc knuckle
MDVDAVDTTGTSNRGAQQSQGQYNRATFLTNEEWKTLLKECRCFNCRTQGHMSKQCPKKGKATTSAPPTIRATKAAAVTEPAPAYDGPTMSGEQGNGGGAALDLIRSMNDEEHTKLLDDLCAEQGF